jgi:nucleoside-diphosphate-sugar epimerase
MRANMDGLFRLTARSLPLPLASLRNKRSLIAVDNLVSALVAGLESAQAAGRTYLVRDGQDVSTPELIRVIARALNVPCRLFPMPASVLKFTAAMIGAGEMSQRLFQSLAVDDSRIRRELGWTAPLTLEQGLARAAVGYKK